MEHTENRVFLYKQVYQELKEQIQSRQYDFGDLLPSEREIGETFRVDRTTVRKALQLLVEEQLVEKRAGKGTVVIWKETQSEPGPAPSRTPNSSIAFFLPKSNHNSNRITQPFYSELFYTAQTECQKHGYSLIYSTLDEQDDFDSILAANNFAGILFISNVSHKHLDRALKLQIPAVLVNSYYENMPSLLSDNFTGTYLACRHLIEHGHKQIGVLNGISSYISNMERMRGCLAALREAGLNLKSEYNLGGDSWEFENGLKAVSELLQKTKTLPTALIAFNDRLALGAVQAISQAGMQVPEHISIIGFDNSDQAKYSFPQITTVEIHVPLIARAAIASLFQQIHEYAVYPVKILTPVELIERDSVQDLRSR